MVHKIRGFAVSICGYGIRQIGVRTAERLGCGVNVTCYVVGFTARGREGERENFQGW